jgi:nucleoside 2-deoxyribosyltransferase
MKETPIVYLAGPYSASDEDVSKGRVKRLTSAAAYLVQNDIVVYSPVTHCYPIARAGGLEGEWEFWAKHCLTMLAVCDIMLVVMLDGWEESIGIAAEMDEAKTLGMHVEFVYYEEVGEFGADKVRTLLESNPP